MYSITFYARYEGLDKQENATVLVKNEIAK